MARSSSIFNPRPPRYLPSFSAATLHQKEIPSRPTQAALWANTLPLQGLENQNGDLLCAEGSSSYSRDSVMKLQAACELAARAITEELKDRECLTSPGAVRDLLKLKLAALPHEVFICIYLDAQHQVITVEEAFRGTLT